MTERSATLKKVLESLYERYNRAELIRPDPLQFVYRYTEPADMEIVALLAAELAYGRVQQIEKSLTSLLALMGKSPYSFVYDFTDARRKTLRGFKHRFTTGRHIAELLSLLKEVLREHGSIEKFFVQGLNAADKNVIPALSKFCGSLCARYAREHGGQVSRGLKYLLASPDGGSACKRLNLFLRWMIRKDQVDPGLWKSIDKAKLVVPVDTHMARLCRILCLYGQKTTSLGAALKITESFLEIQPADPVKYDFALSRIGILEDCDGRYHSRCELCELFDYCLRWDNWAK
jgi:uncharacterized protein (TIGR02757 family)